MKALFVALYFKLQIKVLLVFAPVTLFRKISQLSWYSDTLHSWIELHTIDRSLHVLDVGCASGYLCEYLYRSGHYVSGVDASKAMISAARMHNPKIDFRLANANQLPYEEDRFEIVSSASLINIISNPAQLVEQMLRVCKLNGWITFLFPVSGFNTEGLHKCIPTLGITGFSRAALIAWHELAPKISVENVNMLLKSKKLRPREPKFYLNGMIASISARKDFSI